MSTYRPSTNFVWLPEPDQNIPYLSPYHWQVPNSPKFHKSRQIPRLGSKFCISWKTMVLLIKHHTYTVPASVCKHGEIPTAGASETECGHISLWCFRPVLCLSSCAMAADRLRTQRSCRIMTTDRHAVPSPEHTHTSQHTCTLLVRECSALADPYCQSAWNSVCLFVC